MLIKAMNEVLIIAEKEKIGLTRKDVDYWLEVFGGLNPNGMPSMTQDVQAKRYSEVELFSGTIIRLVKKHNVSVPVNSTFYKYFTELESSY